MSVHWEPIYDNFGAEASGAGIAMPLDNAAAAAIRDGFHRSPHLVFRHLRLDPDKLVALARLFPHEDGPLIHHDHLLPERRLRHGVALNDKEIPAALARSLCVAAK